ncbi:hypothetical protein [Haloarcula halophila]|uniref:hypothetical protein n=1 Tax=Haloarcula TaxID=2237 RepID=UPI0023E3744B|nr:hypothetical protein [Halomicroarcula sp. DFY41]
MASSPHQQTDAYVGNCEDCVFVATGAEAFVRRKASIHIKRTGHRLAVREDSR